MTKTTKKRGVVINMFGRIPDTLSGKRPDTFNIRSLFFATVANYIYNKIYKAYEIKSRGGVDELGNRWPDNTPSTKTKRGFGKGELSKLGLTKRQSGSALKARSRGLLSPAEDNLWKFIFSKYMKRLALIMSEEEARKISAGVAWNIVKSKGARTKLELLGNRDLLIMRATDRLFNSFKPSEVSKQGYRPKKDQIYIAKGNTLTIGTTVPYAIYHSKREPIPDDIDKWIHDAIDVALEAVINKVQENV